MTTITYIDATSNSDIPREVNDLASENCGSLVSNFLFGEWYTQMNSVCTVYIAKNPVGKVIGYSIVIFTNIQGVKYYEIYDLYVSHTENPSIYDMMLKQIASDMSIENTNIYVYQIITSPFFYKNLRAYMNNGLAYLPTVKTVSATGYDLGKYALVLTNRRDINIKDVDEYAEHKEYNDWKNFPEGTDFEVFANYIDGIVNVRMNRRYKKTVTTYELEKESYLEIHNQFKTDDVEMGGPFELEVLEERILMKKPKKPAYSDASVDRCLVDFIPKGVSFHTHPVYCRELENFLFTSPSAPDMRAITRFHFMDILTRHIVFSNEGGYYIRINEDFSKMVKNAINDMEDNKRAGFGDLFTRYLFHTADLYQKIQHGVEINGQWNYSVEASVINFVNRLAVTVRQDLFDMIGQKLKSIVSTREEQELLYNANIPINDSDPLYTEKMKHLHNFMIKLYVKLFNEGFTFNHAKYLYDNTLPEFMHSEATILDHENKEFIDLLSTHNVNIDMQIFEMRFINPDTMNNTIIREINQADDDPLDKFLNNGM